MKRSQENWILSKGWEPATDAERMEIEQAAALDPKLKKQLEMVQMLRDDLKSLRNEPQCQYSSERLQEAIFSAGLKQKQPTLTPLFGKLLAPVTLVAACTIGYFLLMNKPKNLELQAWNGLNCIAEFGLNLEKLPNPSEFMMQPDTQSRLTAISAAVARFTPEPSPAEGIANPTRPRIAHRKHMKSAVSVVALNATPLQSISHDVSTSSVPSPSSDTPGTLDSSASQTPVVVSAGKRDPHTGASVAMEAEKSNDIVIGG